MKRKILLLIIISVLILTGCTSKKNKYHKDVSLNKGKYVVVCESGNLGDNVIKMKSTVTANYNKDKKIINYKVETVEEHTKKKEFEDRKKMYDETYKNLKDSDNNVYDYIVDEKNMKFTMVSIIKKIDITTYGEEEQKTYELYNYITNYEKNAYKCSVKGITRKELGLK